MTGQKTRKAQDQDMPAFRKHQAGRRGRDKYESQDFEDMPRRESAHSRIERLTRTATALGGGHDQDMVGRDEDLDAVADELDRLLANRNNQGSMRPAPAPRRKTPNRQRRKPARETGLDDVIGALDRLDEQVQGLYGDDDPSDDYERTDMGHRAGRYAIDRLEEHVDPYAHDDDEYADYEANSHERPFPRGRRAHHDDRNSNIHVYKDLGRRIDALRKPQEKALSHVREELGALREALGSVAEGTTKTVSRQNAELRRLTDMVERLRNDKKNDTMAKEIRKEVADLKTMVGRTNVEGALQTLEHGYAHILQRLDELSRASIDPRVLRGVTARLNEIEDAFAALPRSEHMVVLEDRVVAIGERVEELLQNSGSVEIEPLRAELKEVRSFVEQIDIKGLVDGIDDRMKFVSNRLDDLEVLAREQRGLDTRLSAMEERMPQPETISRLQGRLEDIVGMMSEDRAAPADTQHLTQVDRRLDEIVDRLERMEQATPLPAADNGAFEALEMRLETITKKIEGIEKKTSRPVPVLDAAAMRAGNGPDSKFLTQLQERLNDLTTRLDQPRESVTTGDLDKLREEIGAMRLSVPEPTSTEALEKRISDLAQIVTKGGGSDDARFEQLGAKVSALAEQIGNAAPLGGGNEQFTAMLERIEQGMMQTRTEVAGIATKAAQEAVANAPSVKNAQYDKAISSLQGDLKRLLDAAEGSEERTKNTFDGVKNVLGSITERLDTIEKSNLAPKAATQPETPAAKTFSPIKVEERAPLFSRAPKEETANAAPSAAAKAEPVTESDKARDRKADFIAAARRAAQAASAEAAQLETAQPEDDADEERGKARVGWLRNVLKRDKSQPAYDETDPDAYALEKDSAEEERQIEAGDKESDRELLAGDRVAPEAEKASGGKRRAIIYTAAAIILLMGGLYVTRSALNSPEGEPQVASNSQENSEAVDVAPVADNGAVTGADVSGEEVEVSAAEPQAIQPETQTTPDLQVSDATVPSVTGTGDAGAPDSMTVPAAADSTLQANSNLAFAAPSGVENSFSDTPAQQPGTFAPVANGAGGTVPENLIASLPPEGVGNMALRSAAASGNAAAEFMVGVKYTEGSGVPADLGKAAVWYQKAAEKGLAPAQYRLASLYEKGRGVTKDLPKAKAWYTQAADAGNAKAMHNLAVLYAEGGGGQPDYAAAAKWFESAANFGVKDSLFNLGILYAGGIGVDKDLVASYKWFAIAADQGDPEAAKRRDDVANMMDQETLANARLAVESFKLQTPPPNANKVQMEADWADQASLPASQAAVTVSADNSGMIRQAQDKLNYLGFDTGTPDGEMGPRTRSAIRAFQRSLGLPETGEVDPSLIEELNSQAI